MSKKYYVKSPEGRIYTTNDPSHWKDCEVLTQTKGRELHRAQAVSDLRKLIKPGDTVYTIIRSVSRSGMSREISPVIITAKEKRAYDISFLVATALEWRHGDRGVKVNGCGMDMGFHLVYELGSVLWPKGTKKPHGRRNGEPDYSGGYALKHEWL